MSITLNDETQKLIEAKMETLGYENADDLVRDAIEFLEASQSGAPGEIEQGSEPEWLIAWGEDDDGLPSTGSLTTIPPT